MNKKQVIIIGGGLAGLTAAIHLSKANINVLLIEKQGYPRHKVCGEYISNEVLPYLDWLGVDLTQFDRTEITRTEFSSVDGKTICSKLPLGGFGISRYKLDHFLMKTAVANGCEILIETVTNVAFTDDNFKITLADSHELEAQLVIGAFGKRSNIDQKLSRSFLDKKSPWLAVKAHYRGKFPNDLVALHNFNGGYCGVSKVEDDVLNICYLADYDSFKTCKNIEQYQRQVVRKNPNLDQIFSNATMLFDKPLTISQISFEDKSAIENHMLMTGDSAGLINPLCGNGMAIAIHSAKITSELTIDFVERKITRQTLEQSYRSKWNANFKSRFKTGRILAKLLQQQMISGLLVSGLTTFPFLLPRLIRKTHGNPINVRK